MHRLAGRLDLRLVSRDRGANFNGPDAGCQPFRALDSRGRRTGIQVRGFLTYCTARVTLGTDQQETLMGKSKSSRRGQSGKGGKKKRGEQQAERPDPTTREEILGSLREADGPLSARQLTGTGVSGGARHIEKTLDAMMRRGDVVRNRSGAYGLPERMDLIEGRVSAHPDGFGFLMPDGGGDDLYLSPRQMRRVMHQDRIFGSVVKVDDRGRLEGTVVEILERANETMVGHLSLEEGSAWVVPDDPRMNHNLQIAKGDTLGAKPGEIVVARINRYPDGKRPPLGEVIEILGHADAPGMAVKIAIHNHQLPTEFPEEALAQADGYGDSIDDQLRDQRKDLTGMPLVTIDGADAKDFDDAVYATPAKNGWRVVVAIADVSTYVQPGDALDTEARHRSTSAYFPGRVVPMLPESLSNGLCSLRPGEDRLCLVCDMHVNEAGKVSRSRFYPAVMHSQARLTYDQVWRYHKNQDDEAVPDKPAVRESLDTLFDVYDALRRARNRRGAIDFDSTEVTFRFDEKGQVEDIMPVQRHDAHKLIEECMIAANVQAAKFLMKQKPPGIYRVHAPPQERKLESLQQFLQQQGIRVPWKESPEPAHFEKIVEIVKDREDRELIMAVLLRAMSLAVYDIENEGHFGLALEAYTHFTSPIRRYPDLLVHRAIVHAVTRQPPRQFPHNRDQMGRMAEHASMAERRAEEASRDVDERLKAEYLKRHIGETFEGIITGVTSFGLFVELLGSRVSGLVHVSNLGRDYFHFDPVSHRMTGERSGQVFKLADRLEVKVARVDIDERKVDFELAGDQQ